MRVCALTWPFSFGVRLGWATAWTPNPPIGRAVGRAYLLRGQAVVFSRGFGTMCDQLRRAGLWAEDLRCVGDRWVRRHLLTDHQAGRLHGPIIFVGHSCGGRYALYTAQQLAEHGITVDLVICIDVAGPFDVSANVKHAVHLYRSRRRIYPARPLRLATGSTGQITNLDLDAEDSPIAPQWLCHLNITASPAVQAWIVGHILEASVRCRSKSACT
jgi:pimeloyl-ACP methyl ester carboxylesterase